MVNEKPITRGELDTIIEVNKTAIEIHNEVSAQNEEIMEELEKSKEIGHKILEELQELKILKEYNNQLSAKFAAIEKDFEDMHKNQFRTHVLLASGIVTALAQIFTMLRK